MLENKLKFRSKFVNVSLALRLLCGSALITLCGCSHHGTTIIRCHIPLHHLYYFLMGIVFILSILGLMKSCIGLCCSPNVEVWGLETFVNCSCDFCEGDCYPKTRRKLFFLNVIFFFICPFLFVFYACQSINSNKCRNQCYNNDWIITAKDKTVTTIKNNRANVKACGTPSTDEEIQDVEYIKQMLQSDEIDSSNIPFVVDLTKTEVGNQCTKFQCSKRDVTNFGCYRNSTEYVNLLLCTKIVYRNLKYPLGRIRLPKCCVYSIKGCFIGTKCNSYKFIPSCPFKQYWTFCEDKFLSLERPLLLDAREFQVIYPNAEEVGYANELSVMPKYFCVNNPKL